MKIVVWKAESDAPTAHAYLARFLGKDGFLPAFCTATTEDAVREKAAAFIEAETARLQKGGKPRGKPDPVEKPVDDIIPPPIDETPAAPPIIPESDLDDLLA